VWAQLGMTVFVRPSVRPFEWMSIKFRIRGVPTNVDLHVSTVNMKSLFTYSSNLLGSVSLCCWGGGGFTGLWGVLLSAYFLECSCRFTKCVVSHPEGTHRPLGPILIVFDKAHCMNIVAPWQNTKVLSVFPDEFRLRPSHTNIIAICRLDTFYVGNRYSSGGVVTRLRAEWPRNRSFIPCKLETYRPALRPTQPPIQCVPG
jgi:hypothetical protein